MFQQELILGVAGGGAQGAGARGEAARQAGPSILTIWLEYGTKSVTDPPEVSQAHCHCHLNKVYIMHSLDILALIALHEKKFLYICVISFGIYLQKVFIIQFVVDWLTSHFWSKHLES